MVYSNFDTRTKGACAIPHERLAFLRKLEAQVRSEREARKIARSRSMAKPVEVG